MKEEVKTHYTYTWRRDYQSRQDAGLRYFYDASTGNLSVSNRAEMGYGIVPGFRVADLLREGEPIPENGMMPGHIPEVVDLHFQFMKAAYPEYYGDAALAEILVFEHNTYTWTRDDGWSIRWQGPPGWSSWADLMRDGEVVEVLHPPEGVVNPEVARDYLWAKADAFIGSGNE